MSLYVVLRFSTTKTFVSDSFESIKASSFSKNDVPSIIIMSYISFSKSITSFAFLVFNSSPEFSVIVPFCKTYKFGICDCLIYSVAFFRFLYLFPISIFLIKSVNPSPFSI